MPPLDKPAGRANDSAQVTPPQPVVAKKRRSARFDTEIEPVAGEL
jgi:hypothetical protein